MRRCGLATRARLWGPGQRYKRASRCTLCIGSVKKRHYALHVFLAVRRRATGRRAIIHRAACLASIDRMLCSAMQLAHDAIETYSDSHSPVQRLVAHVAQTTPSCPCPVRWRDGARSSSIACMLARARPGTGGSASCDVRVTCRVRCIAEWVLLMHGLGENALRVHSG